MAERRHGETLPLGGEGQPPYSRGLMTRALMRGGLNSEHAYELASRIETDLNTRDKYALEIERLREIAVKLLGESDGNGLVWRLLRYQRLDDLEVPVILLIGGATGTGKSSVAAEVARRLGITRVTSTDFLRQTMRALFSKEFMPSIHYSSFEVGEYVGTPGEDSVVSLLRGFLEQTRHVLVGVQASVDRALHEGLSMVIEGVHVVPGMLPTATSDALVVQCVLAIESEEAHASHFSTRVTSSAGARPPRRYLERLAEIRALQTFIVEQAVEAGVPVATNTDVRGAVEAVTGLVLAHERLDGADD
jgi:2-phosphoglycerate kinase